MSGQSPITRHELQIFDGALCQEESVEGIARVRLRTDFGQSVARFDRHGLQTEVLQQLWPIRERIAQRELAEPNLDRNLPDARYARMKLYIAPCEDCSHRSRKLIRLLFNQSD